MDYKNILEAINEYENMNSKEVWNSVMPVINSHYIPDLAKKIGCTNENIYRLTRKAFVESDQKIPFVLYTKIMAYADDESISHKSYKYERKEKMTPEERKEKKDAYNHQYYRKIIANKPITDKKN